MSIVGFVQLTWQRRFVRFGVVGTINSLTDLTLLNLLVFGFGVHILLANAFSATISIVLSYFWNHILVFNRRSQIGVRRFVYFVIVTATSVLVIQTLVIHVVTMVVPTHRLALMTGVSLSQATVMLVNAAKILAILSAMTWNFLLYKYFVFNNPHPT
ncbi:MAG: GtrA family protein [Candidatus Saccharimonadales bacterium]